jgi:hypothetical protein
MSQSYSPSDKKEMILLNHEPMDRGITFFGTAKILASGTDEESCYADVIYFLKRLIM